uniref:F-box domain-containing protein n=1 Tax=Panagrellus redivivus TaxID=6233 RepID=A0A7E4VN56_PANRE
MNQLYDVITTKYNFPLPEVVKFRVSAYPTQIRPFRSFPQVKNLHLDMSVDKVKLEFIKLLPTILKCFPNVEAPTINLTSKHDSADDDIPLLNEVYQFFETADFHAKVKIDYQEKVYVDANSNRFNDLKNLGFEANVVYADLSIVKAFPKVHLTHSVELIIAQDLSRYVSYGYYSGQYGVRWDENDAYLDYGDSGSEYDPF